MLRALAIVALVLLSPAAVSFRPPPRCGSRAARSLAGRARRGRGTALRAESSDLAASDGADPQDNGLVDELLGKMDTPGKYNTVLGGLCAAYLSEGPGGARGGSGAGALEELATLLQEMSRQRIAVSTGVAGDVVDCASAAGSAACVAQLVRQLRSCGTSKAFGTSAAQLRLLPSDGAKRAAALSGLAPPPSDSRGNEITAALAACAFGATEAGLEVASPFAEDGTLLHSAVLPEVGLALAAAGAAFDVYSNGGKVVNAVSRGLRRLFYTDPEREARCEAASLLVGYLLGLPSFPFRPSVGEAIGLLEQTRSSAGEGPPAPGAEAEEALRDMLPPLASSVQRLLVWLFAPVAAEDARHAQLLAADPREARAFLTLARSRGFDGCGEDAEAAEEMLRWAFAEARRIVRVNEGTLDVLAERMESKAGSAGECVAIIEAAV